jgi:hypothetical protein
MTVTGKRGKKATGNPCHRMVIVAGIRYRESGIKKASHAKAQKSQVAGERSEPQRIGLTQRREATKKKPASLRGAQTTKQSRNPSHTASCGGALFAVNLLF